MQQNQCAPSSPLQLDSRYVGSALCPTPSLPLFSRQRPSALVPLPAPPAAVRTFLPLRPHNHLAVLARAGEGVHGQPKVRRPGHITHPVCRRKSGQAVSQLVGRLNRWCQLPGVAVPTQQPGSTQTQALRTACICCPLQRVDPAQPASMRRPACSSWHLQVEACLAPLQLPPSLPPSPESGPRPLNTHLCGR